MTVTFKTDDETSFRFDRKTVIQLLENRKSSYNIQELDTLIKVIANQPDQTIISSAENPYFAFIALELINSTEGSVVCKNCGKQYRFNQLEAFTVGPDEATFKDVKGKIGQFKNLFRKKKKLPGMYGGKGYKCPRGHTLLYLVTWRS